MGWLDKLTGIPDPSKTVEAVGGVLDDLFTSKEEKLTHKEVMERLRQRPKEAQWKINLAEAAHRTVFVAGWRPAIGWVAATSLFFFYVPQYVIASYVWVTVIIESGFTTPLPAYPATSAGLFELVAGLLGLGLMRTHEKKAGVAK